MAELISYFMSHPGDFAFIIGLFILIFGGIVATLLHERKYDQ